MKEEFDRDRNGGKEIDATKGGREVVLNEERGEKKEGRSEVGQKNEGRNDRGKRKKWSVRKRVIVGILGVVGVGLGLVLAYVFMILGKTTEIFEGSPIEVVFGADLKEDEKGRSNILVFGTAEDDEGHSGAMLADSILVVSLDQKTGEGKMFSVPRDLWVEYGMACTVGYQGKINATYMCAKAMNQGDAKAAGAYFANKVGEIFGMEIPYFIGVDFAAVRGVTDALGGIDVDVYSDDPRGLYDINMKLNLAPGVNHLNGETALRLARARNSAGGYGLSRSNFDREINQQRIIQAMFKKASNIGFLANVGGVLDLLNSLGENVKTNITMGEVRKVIDVLGNGAGVESVDSSGFFKTGMIGAASVVVPKAASVNAPFNYEELRNIFVP